MVIPASTNVRDCVGIRTRTRQQMSNWIILNIEPSLASVAEGERVARLSRVTYTLQEMVTGEVKKLTCGLGDRWVDEFLTAPSSDEAVGLS